MPLQFTLLERLLKRVNVLPTPLLDMPLACGLGKALVVACEKYIFDVLDDHALTLEVLAARVDCQPQGLQLLLQLLVSADYLRLRNGLYKNAPAARRWLVSRSPHCIAPYILHAPDIVAIWDHLPEIVHQDRPAIAMPYMEGETAESQRVLARHYAGLAALANALGGEVVGKARLRRGARRLLDIGGSHAAYSALYCQRYKQVQATILDLPVGLEAGRLTAKLKDLEDRMQFVSADIVQDDFAGSFSEPFDVALYFHVAHLLQPEVNQMVLAKVASILKPGGMLVFLDQLTDQAPRSRLSTTMVQLMTITMHITGGTCYPLTMVKQWLESVGMQRIQKHHLLIPGVTLITAIKA